MSKSGKGQGLVHAASSGGFDERNLARFGEYVSYLESLIARCVQRPCQEFHAVDAALDGQTASVARDVFSVDQLRKSGAFFTGARLARQVVTPLAPSISANSVVVDPTSGAGDLLIACSLACPVLADLPRTLDLWGRVLAGRDIQPAFVLAAKARLVLAAIRRGVPTTGFSVGDIQSLFPQLRPGCALSEGEDTVAHATHIVMNPPFTLVPSPTTCRWASGTVNAAALFLEACLNHACAGTQLVAILPDVLRSGSRYERWRKIVESRLSGMEVDMLGQFDKWADVDVFVLRGTVTAAPAPRRPNWTNNPCRGKTVGDYFRVSVGPVVPYRDPHKGPWRPFLQARGLECWQEVRSLNLRRRFAGRTASSPFVVVRRTSRPGDECRATATLIAGNAHVAVENHLIVLEPIRGTLRACHQLMDVLRSARTTDWLNQRIRCRHLTVSAVQGIPWLTGKKRG